MTQNDILIYLKKSDQRALTYLYDKYSLTLLRFINLYIKDRDLSKDILQETFISLWSSKENFSDDTKFDKLLFTISKNKALNALRSQNNREKHTISESHLGNHINIELLDSFEMNSLDDEDVNNEIARLYNSLPAIYKEVFTKSRIEGMTYTQIASDLDISPKTVEKRMSKTLSILRDRIKFYFFLFFA